MAKATTSTATWTQIDIDTLPAEIKAGYDSYREAYAEMKRIRKGFEDSLADCITTPAGKRVVFGYNFGKLSVAIVDDTAKPKASTNAVSLATLIKRV